VPFKEKRAVQIKKADIPGMNWTQQFFGINASELFKENRNVQIYKERGCIMKDRTISNLNRDYISSNLKSQVEILQNILNNLDELEGGEGGYINESFLRVESSVRRLRKYCKNFNN
jgi:hypothetical protein